MRFSKTTRLLSFAHVCTILVPKEKKKYNQSKLKIKKYENNFSTQALRRTENAEYLYATADHHHHYDRRHRCSCGGWKKR